MWSRNQRQVAVKLFLRRLRLLGLLILVLAAVSGAWSAYQKQKESATLRAQTARGKTDLQTREAQLQADLAKLKTDRGKEEILRTQYALSQKGERLIVIVDTSSTSPLHASSTVFETLRRFFWPW